MLRGPSSQVGVLLWSCWQFVNNELDLMMIKSSSLFLSSKQAALMNSSLTRPTQCYINIVSAMGVTQTVRTPPPLPSRVSINSGPRVIWVRQMMPRSKCLTSPCQSSFIAQIGFVKPSFPSVLMRNHVIYGAQWNIFNGCRDIFLIFNTKNNLTRYLKYL